MHVNLKRKHEKNFTAEPEPKKNVSGARQWQLKIDENPWNSSICEVFNDNSALNEWKILPSAELGIEEDWFGQMDPEKVSIVKNFMIICFQDKFLFVNLLSRKLFWISQKQLESQIEYVLIFHINSI